MNVTLDLTPEPAKKTWNQLWNKVRAPLHKIISYGELIVEDSAGEVGAELQAHISKLLTACESALADTQANFRLTVTEGADSVKIISTLLMQHQSSLESIAAEIKRLSTANVPESLQNDIRIICKTVDSLESTFQNLSIVPSNDHTQQLPNGPKGASAQLKTQPDQLIAQVEYLGLLLVVDDDEGNRDVLSRRLLRDGYEVMLAENGRQALRMLNRYAFDLVLLDIMMPGLDGISVLAELRRNPKLNQLPVIMITAVDEIESLVRCIEAGADDYLLKPFNPVLLRARIHALLDRKRLQDEQQRQREELVLILENSRRQAERAEKMLLNILPAAVAEELREYGSVRPMYFEDVTIVFADIVGFTLSTEQLPADELVELLHQFFTNCDKIVARYGLEKLKTIGDCYMFAGGLPVRRPSHPVDCVLAAIEVVRAMAELSSEGKVNWQIRIGINTGPVIAGVVGIHKFSFDIWGDSVNFTARVEACGAAGRINLSPSTFVRIKDFFACEKREKVRVKEGREVEMYFVNGIATSLSNKPQKTSLEAFKARYVTFFRTELQAFPASIFEPPPQG